MPSDSTAQLNHSPSPIETADSMSDAVTGTDELVREPSPSSPLPLPPQHRTVPSSMRAHVWLFPAESCVASLSPLTCTGVCPPVVVPLPSCPALLLPQHVAVPSKRSAQLCSVPRPTPVAPETPGTVVGVVESTYQPRPTWP